MLEKLSNIVDGVRLAVSPSAYVERITQDNSVEVDERNQMVAAAFIRIALNDYREFRPSYKFILDDLRVEVRDNGLKLDEVAVSSTDYEEFQVLIDRE